MPNNTDGPTPYDDVFRTMTYKGGSLVIPLVNLLFHLNLPVTAKVDHMADEQYATFQNGKQVKTIADAIIHIDGKPYHLECQAYDDNTIVIRMVRYDLEEAMLEAHFENNEYIVTVPFSGILCLRRPKDSPETWTVRIRTGETDGIYHIRAIYGLPVKS